METELQGHNTDPMVRQAVERSREQIGEVLQADGHRGAILYAVTRPRARVRERGRWSGPPGKRAEADRHMYVITYSVGERSHGPRLSARACARCARGCSLSLRDLAERSGVSAPMLSQVERGETSPTLSIAERIAGGLELSLSQLLRLDEGDAVTVVRAGGAPLAAGSRARPPLRGRSPRRCPASAPRSRCTCSPPAPPPAGPDDPPMHEPGARETAVVLEGELRLVCDGAAHDLGRRATP